MQHRSPRLRRVALAVTTAVAAAAVAASLAPAAGAAPARTAAPSAPVAKWTAHLQPAGASGVSTRSASSGARSGDFTLDTVHDILARDARNGQLKVYPHSGSYSGTGTFVPATTINYGWATMRWIGQGEMDGDGRDDVLYIDPSGVMRIARHSGAWSGTATIQPGEVVGTGWNINDLVFTDDWDADGFDDVLARRAGTGDIFVYRNSGSRGLAMFQAPQLVATGPTDDVTLTMGDFTNDSVTDLLFIRPSGRLGVFDFTSGDTYELGYGWETINAITIADVNRDGVIDILGRRASDSVLLAYTHTGSFVPDSDLTAYSTLNAPVVMGYNWWINDVIV